MKQAVKERVTKSPLERKQELIDAATRLFMKGAMSRQRFQTLCGKLKSHRAPSTTISALRKRSWKPLSKKIWLLLEESVRQIMRKEDADAAMKINAIVNGIIGISSSRKEIMDYLHRESNAVMHEKMERHTIERLVPLMAKVIAEGTNAGIFDCEHPTELAEFLLASTVYFFHHPEIFADPSRRDKMQRTLETILAEPWARRITNSF